MEQEAIKLVLCNACAGSPKLTQVNENSLGVYRDYKKAINNHRYYYTGMLIRVHVIITRMYIRVVECRPKSNISTYNGTTLFVNKITYTSTCKFLLSLYAF